jgi:CHAD domain-containing protein
MDPGYCRLAAQYIRRQAKQLAEQLEGVRAAEDIEFVHRARVATRRLRTALRMFDGCFARKRIRRWRKAIRRTTSALGDARDRDVQIELLCGMLSATSEEQCLPGVARVLVHLERDRERLQRKVVQAVARLDTKGILKEMRQAAGEILAGCESTPPAPLMPESLACVQEHVLRQLDELLAHQESLANPEDRDRHHAMRIAAKRLRYTLEICRAVHPGRLDAAVEATKKAQTLLGDVHDCDVWLDHLDAFARTEQERIVAMFGHAGRFHRLLPGIEYLQSDLGDRRRLTFQHLVAFWADLQSQRLWEELRAVVHPAAEAAAPADRPAEVVAPPTPSDPVPSQPPATTTAVETQPRAGGNGAGDVQTDEAKPLLTSGS